MSAAQVHAQEAAQALSGVKREPATYRTTHAKVALYDAMLQVQLSPEVAAHFPAGVRARFDPTLVPGKLVVEVINDPKAQPRLSPHKGSGGVKILQISPAQVINCGKTFPKFGMTSPDSVVLGRDGVLRITLPGKRNPLARPNKKIKRTKKTKIRKEPEVQEKEAVQAAPAPAEPPQQFIPLSTPPDRERMQVKDTMVAYSPHSVRIILGRKLAQQMDSHRYLIKSMKPWEDGLTITLMQSPTNGARVGTSLVKGGFRTMTLPHPPMISHQSFSPTTAAWVDVVREGEEIVIHVSPPFSPPQSKSPRRPKAVVAEAIRQIPADDSGLGRIRRLRDEVNATVRELREAGDEVTLRIKDDGSLGFIYEG